MKRLLLVAKEHRHLLDAAVQGAVSQAGRDIYEAVKRVLTQKNVPHEERHMNPADVPSHRAYWHT